jgi:plastocyanin
MGAVLAVVLAACGGAPDHGGAGREVAAGTRVVDMPRSYLFRPESVEVRVGDSLGFANHDVFTHAVRVAGGRETGAIEPGASTMLRFDSAGVYRFDCPYHPQMMKGVVVVRGAQPAGGD